MYAEYLKKKMFTENNQKKKHYCKTNTFLNTHFTFESKTLT